jgi:hypothetical protein
MAHKELNIVFVFVSTIFCHAFVVSLDNLQDGISQMLLEVYLGGILPDKVSS